LQRHQLTAFDPRHYLMRRYHADAQAAGGGQLHVAMAAHGTETSDSGT
jgi:hypothetical protein